MLNWFADFSPKLEFFGFFLLIVEYHRAGKLGPGGAQRSVLLVKKHKKTDAHRAQASRAAKKHLYTDSLRIFLTQNTRTTYSVGPRLFYLDN